MCSFSSFEIQTFPEYENEELIHHSLVFNKKGKIQKNLYKITFALADFGSSVKQLMTDIMNVTIKRVG